MKGSRGVFGLVAAKTESLADVSVFDFDGSLLGSTFVSEEGRDELSAVQGETKPAGQKEQISLYGREFTFLYGDLKIRNQVVGRFSVALPSDFIAHASANTGYRLAIIFGLATAVVLLTGLTIARAVTAPLLNLVATARAVSDGDLTARSGIKSLDVRTTLGIYSHVIEGHQEQAVSVMERLLHS